MQKEPIKLIIYKYFYKYCHIKFQYQFHHSYRLHIDLFSITIFGFHFNLINYTWIYRPPESHIFFFTDKKKYSSQIELTLFKLLVSHTRFITKLCINYQKNNIYIYICIYKQIYIYIYIYIYICLCILYKYFERLICLYIYTILNSLYVLTYLIS